MRRSVAILAILFAAGGLPPAMAQARGSGRQISSPITDRFALRASFFAASVDTDLRLDDLRSNTPGTPLSAEGDLGLDDRLDQERIELTFRLRERHRLRADYFKASRSARRPLGRPLVFGEERFAAGEAVASSLDWRMLAFTYYGSVLRRERYELGVGLGVHLIEARAEGEAPARFAREEASGVAPFPTVALDGTWRLSRRFALTARAQYLSAAVDELDGSLGDYHLDAQYRWRRNLSVGLGYSNIRARLEVQDRDFPGRLDLDLRGPELFFRASF